ncbi:11660_t:CDS:2, partial [Scutellospora calospora]
LSSDRTIPSEEKKDSPSSSERFNYNFEEVKGDSCEHNLELQTHSWELGYTNKRILKTLLLHVKNSSCKAKEDKRSIYNFFKSEIVASSDNEEDK